MNTPNSSTPVPFRTRHEVASRSFVKRFLRLADQDGAVQSVTNLFVTTDPSDVTPTAVVAAAAAHGVMGDRLRVATAEVFRAALNAFLADSEITGAERDYLLRLRAALGLDAATVLEQMREAARPALERLAKLSARDGELSDAEGEAIFRLGAALHLAESDTRAIVVGVVRDIVHRELNAFIADRRYAPDEERRLTALAKSLGIGKLVFDDDTRKQLEHYRAMWEVENAAIPVVPVSIALQRGETCHFAAPCQWWELRTRTVRSVSSGFSGSVRIMKGVRYRVGSTRTHRVTQTELTQLDAGRAYITNKRIIFDGNVANKTIRLSALIGFELFSDGIKLEKSAGKSPYLLLGVSAEGMERAGVILSELLARA